MFEVLHSDHWVIKVVWFIMVAAFSFAATLYYRKIAIRRNIIAKINFRSLHKKVIPRGGGVAFAFIFTILIIFFWWANVFDLWLVLSFTLGGIAAITLGFLDDILEIDPVIKLISHTILSLFFLFIFFIYHPFSFVKNTGVLIPAILIGMWVFVPLWFINLFNFIDGIDGMAAAATIFICFAAIVVLTFNNGDVSIILLFALLAASCMGFIFFNLPPASIFMGDAGSIFIGYCIGALVLTTLYMNQVTFWNWLILLSYYLADTTCTTIMRVFLVKKWYGVHRSHAYQNVARIKNSHSKVTYGILLYNIIWVFPLLIWSLYQPQYAYVAAILAVTPSVIWSLRYGPLLSSK